MSFVPRSSNSLPWSGSPSAFVCSNCRVKLSSDRSFKNSARSIHVLLDQTLRGILKERSTLARSHNHQRRWITRNHIRNIMQAEQDWEARRKEIEAGRKQSILELLEERGFVNQIVGTRDDLKKLLDNRRVGIYAGIDPTAPSMHVGHMVVFMALSWLYVHGYPATFLLGGSTARIGDPEGRLSARKPVDRARRTEDMASMHSQLKRFGVNMEKYAEGKGFVKEWSWRRALVNNNTWHVNTSMMDFVRLMANHTRLGPMLGRDTVKNRMEKGEGMSLAELMYPLLQAWDWWKLFEKGTQIQIGGADQFGNILEGAKAVKVAATVDHWYNQKIEQEAELPSRGKDDATNDPLGFTVPLLTTASGEKFGKSAGNAVWLDPNMTSEYDLYQFWLRTADADAERYLRLFTFLPMNDIKSLMQEHEKDPSQRVAQHQLAREFVELIHGVTAAKRAESDHRQVFNKSLTLEDVRQMHKQSKEETIKYDKDGKPLDWHPSLNKHATPQHMERNTGTSVTLPSSVVIGKHLPQVLFSAGLVASKGEGQRLISAAGVYIGGKSGENQKMSDDLSFVPIKSPIWSDWSRYLLGNDDFLILRTGKWRVKFVKVVSDEEFEAAGLTCPGWPLDAPITKQVSRSQNELPFPSRERIKREQRIST